MRLSKKEYERYGRQMIMSHWGLQGQLKLKYCKIALVGAGGLGCPCLVYLAGAGVGTIGIFDPDTVSLSNLHRQVLHTTERVGMNKSDSARLALEALNPLTHIIPHPIALTPTNALSHLTPYDLIIDCTDRPLTRYLLNDVAVKLGVPLVSGAAVSSVGQWSTYCFSSIPPRPFSYPSCDSVPSTSSSTVPTPIETSSSNNTPNTSLRLPSRFAWETGRGGPSGSRKRASGQNRNEIDHKSSDAEGEGKDSDRSNGKTRRRACYRCMWPEVVGESAKCDEHGVWGTVTGMVGTGMATEAIKVIMGLEEDCNGTLHILDLLSVPMIRSVELRPPRVKCTFCGPSSTLPDDLSEVDYETFCAGLASSTFASGSEVRRVQVKKLVEIFEDMENTVVIDTRPEVEYDMCHLPLTINIPLSDILRSPSSIPKSQRVVFICKRGNDSLIAARSYEMYLSKNVILSHTEDSIPATQSVSTPPGSDSAVGSNGDSDDGQNKVNVLVTDVIGGLEAWSREVDETFPIY
ncbi:hypothetical protein M231_05331 [Tremella mesenterica]|uniref:Rhodanese domain-containing protein n=1 Tax=Tremella mesenterica TaxID=5217 RepID=A0A4Q1BIF6_TREME|nr:hypothetical protein M231_05331 [Tremella mesenterica]